MSTIYHYHPQSCFLQGQSVADPNPQQPGDFLVPAFATLVEPPELLDPNNVLEFVEELNTWTEVTPPVVEPEVPVEPPPPPPPVEPTLDEVKERGQQELDEYFEVLYNLSVPNPAIAQEYQAAYHHALKWLEALTAYEQAEADYYVSLEAYQTAMAQTPPPDPAPAEPVAPTEPMVPVRVQALAETYSISILQAAQLVVQKWNEAETAYDLRGAARLRAKAAVRCATDVAGITEAVQVGMGIMASVQYTV